MVVNETHKGLRPPLYTYPRNDQACFAVTIFRKPRFSILPTRIALNLAVAEAGQCVKEGAPSALDTTVSPPLPLIESNGTKLNDSRNVIPYSIVDYNVQSSGAVTDVSGYTKMRRINGIIPDLDNRLFPFLEPVFNVIPTANATQPDPPASPREPTPTTAQCSSVKLRASARTRPSSRAMALASSTSRVIPVSCRATRAAAASASGAARLSSPAPRPPDLLIPPRRE